MNDTTTADPSPDARRTPVNAATLYIMLSQEFGSSIDYDAQEGELSARCSAQGYVWNTESAFQFKRCHVTFRRHATGRLPDFAHEHGLDGACGSIQIASRLEPETFDADGEEVTLPPIEIHIVLDDGGYDRTEKLLRACISPGREASLSLRFSHRDFTRLSMALNDLDLATKCTYPVVSFSLGGTRSDNTTVRVPKYSNDAATSAGLTFTATAASIQARLKSQKLGVDSDDETIEIKEYEANRGWKPGYPEEAFPGVVSVSREEAITYCWVTLYATKDILARLASLLAGMSKGDTVRFDVSMITEGLPLKVGERRYFNVTGYTPVLVKSYS
jgi:hypothetical protein